MASRNLSADGEGPSDFHDNIKNEQCEDVEPRVEPYEMVEDPNNVKDECLDDVKDECLHDVKDECPEDEYWSRSRSPLPRAPYSADGSGSPPVLAPSNVVVTTAQRLNDYNDAMEEDHVFHLADEHPLFQQVEDEVEVAAEQRQQQRRPQRGAARRGGTAQRGRGRGRGAQGQVPSGGPQWVNEERMFQVYLTDDDVPEDVREGIMRVVNAREARRVHMINRSRSERVECEEERLNADGGVIDPLAAEGTSDRFEWSPMGDFQGAREQFLPQETGAVVPPENAYEAFRQFWDEDTLTHIVTETNRYAAGLVGSSASFARDWYDTNVHEILCLFSFWMMLGIIRMPSIDSCFTTNPLLQTNVFSKMFSRNRYKRLCRAFHLNDNSSRRTDSTDVLYSLGPIADRLNARFQQAYIPSQNICIDESLTLWKTNLSFREYIKAEAAQNGVKTYELCESSTGYLWSFFIHRGAGASNNSGFPSTNIVLNLIKPLLNKGYTLFLNSCFSSPLLARFLKTRKTDCVGTLHANCSNVPPLMSKCKLKDGQSVAHHSGDVVVLTFQDKKGKIATISTYHGDSQGQMKAKPHRPSLYKPQVVSDYHKAMGGVDPKGSTLEPYLPEMKSRFSWNVEFFKHLLDCSILNARILLQSTSTTPKYDTVFRLELVNYIVNLHHHHVPLKAPEPIPCPAV